METTNPQAENPPTNQPKPPEPDPDNARIPQAVRQRVGIGSLTDLFSVLRMEKQNALNRRLVRKTQDGTLGNPGPDNEGDEDDMGTVANVGDQYIYNYQQPGNAPAPASSGGSGLKTAAIAGLSALTAGGLATMLPYLLPLLLFPKEEPAQPTNPPAVESVDTDTLYDLRFAEPKGTTNE